MSYIFVHLSIFTLLLFATISVRADAIPLSQAWDVIQSNDRDIRAAGLAIQSQQERINFSKEWEDPTIEWLRSNRDVTGVSSQINTVSLRQTLPIWSDRSRSKDVEAAVMGVAVLNKEMTEHEKEHDFVFKVYELKKNNALLEQLQKHQQYINAIQENLKKIVQISPQVKMDSAQAELKAQELDVSINELKSQILRIENELKIMSNNEFSSVHAEWPQTLPALGQDFGRSRMVKYQTQQLEVSKRKELQSQSRPKFELLFSQASESGGSQEKNTSMGIAVTLPLFSLNSAQKKSLGFETKVQQSYLEQAKLNEEIKRTTLSEEKKQVETLQKIYSEQSSLLLQKKLSQAKLDLSLGKISMLQFLDFEERVRLHFEKYINLKMKMVHAMVVHCELENDDLIDLLEGKK